MVSLLGGRGLLASSPAAALPPVRDLEEAPPVSDVPEAEPASAETEVASPEEASGAGDDLDDMWAEAFAEQEGEAATAEAASKPEGAGAEGGDAGGGDDDIIGQGELDALLAGGQAPQEESPPEEKGADGPFAGPEEAGAPALDSAAEATPGGGDGGEEDEEELEAYIPEDEKEEERRGGYRGGIGR